MAKEERDHPGVIAPPPVIGLGFLLAGLGADYAWPSPGFHPLVRIGLGGLTIALSFLIAIPAMREFKRAGTSFDVHKPDTALLTSGLYRRTRNPLYVAMFVLYFGLAIVLNSWWAFFLAVPAFFIMHYGVVLREERYLEAKFGDDYRRYKESVRRWI